MAVQITKEFLTNVTLFILAIVALGLSIGAIMNNPCKDKFGDITCNGLHGSIDLGEHCFDLKEVCGRNYRPQLCKKDSTCKGGKCVSGPEKDCRTMRHSDCIAPPGGSGGGSFSCRSDVNGLELKCGQIGCTTKKGNQDCPAGCGISTIKGSNPPIYFCGDPPPHMHHSPSQKKSPSHHTGPTGSTHTQFDPRFGNGGKSVGGKGKSKQSSSEDESQDESGGEPNPHDLTWLWITLGSVGGVALLATLFLMMKKK